MVEASQTSFKKIAANRKAFRDYEVLERLEAGIELLGTEVKSIRTGRVSLVGSFVQVDDGQAVLRDLNIPPYEHGNRFNHDATRPRRLLLRRRELGRISMLTRERGYTAVPLSAYWKRGWVKVEIGVCRGKRRYDKRETLKRRAEEREVQRATRRGGRARRPRLARGAA
jgi:SsrA-binding protein